MCLCTDIRQPNIGGKIIYLSWCTLVYWLFAILGNCFNALDIQNADIMYIHIKETLSFCHRNPQKCSLTMKKAVCLAFSEKLQIDDDDLGPPYILKRNQSLRSTGFLCGNSLMYLTWNPPMPHMNWWKWQKNSSAVKRSLLWLLLSSVSNTVLSLPQRQGPWFISTLLILLQFNSTVLNYWYKTEKKLLLGLPRDQSSTDTSGTLQHPLEKKHAGSLNHQSYKFQIRIFIKHFSHWHTATWGKYF